jgi:membrane protease YdiL (CAAX protease family)
LEPWRWWDGSAWTGHVGDGVPTLEEVQVRRWFPRRGDVDRTGAIRGFWLAVGAFLVGIGGSVAWGWVASRFDWSDGGQMLASQLGLWIPLVVACLLAVRRYGTGRLRDLGARGLGWRDLARGTLWGVGTRVGSALAVAPFAPFVLRDAETRGNPINDALHGSTLTAVVTVGIVVVGAPLVEELFFRGLVQGALTARFGAWWALLLQAACFGAVHYQYGMSWGWALLTIVSIGLAGLALGTMRWYYQRLAPGIIAHATFNAITVVLLLALA